ncbi:hypothetical protein LXL04_030681 [Taraxacum kok-saghyz]
MDLRTFRLCFHKPTPPETPTTSFPISSTIAQALAGFAVVLSSSVGCEMGVPAGRSLPEMKLRLWCSCYGNCSIAEEKIKIRNPQKPVEAGKRPTLKTADYEIIEIIEILSCNDR